MKKLLFTFGLLFVLTPNPSTAQNTTCATRPNGTNDNSCASTAFVNNEVAFNGYVKGPGTSVVGNVPLWNNITGNLLSDSGISGLYKQPISYPPNITAGHFYCAADSDCQFGNSWSQYPLGMVSENPLIVGKAGSSIGSSTIGQVFQIVFTSTGLAGSPITISYTAIGGDTVTTIAANLCNRVNANTTLYNSFGQPIFCQSLGGGVFNLQYTAAFSTTGASPLTTTTTGSTGTITLAAEQNVLDFVIGQYGRNVFGRSARSGDALYAMDFTGQDSTGVFNTNYAQITIAAANATAGATQGIINFNTAKTNGGPGARFAIGLGAFLYDSSGALPTGGDPGAGSFNIPTSGSYYLGGNVMADSVGLFAPGNNVFGGIGTSSQLNLQSTQNGAPSGDFVQITAGGTIGYKYDGTSSTIKAPLIIKGAFSSLATCATGIEGQLAAITDSTTATWGATITGSGTNHVLGYCNGTNWTVAGK